MICKIAWRPRRLEHGMLALLLLSALSLKAQSLQLVSEVALGPLSQERVLKPAICPDGKVLSLVAGVRLSILGPSGQVLSQISDPFPREVQALFCLTGKVLAAGTGFVQEYVWDKGNLVAAIRQELPMTLNQGIVLGDELVLVGARKQDLALLKVRPSNGQWQLLRSQAVEKGQQDRHKNAWFDAEFALSRSGDAVFVASPRSLTIEKLKLPNLGSGGIYQFPYPVVLDRVVDKRLKQGDSLYGLGVLPSGEVVSQVIRRSQKIGREATNLLLLLDPRLESHKQLDVTGKRTGLLSGVLPDGALVFTAHTRQGGEKLRFFRLKE